MKAFIGFVVLMVAMLSGSVVLADADAVFREAVRNAVATGLTALATGKIRVGGADNVAAAVTPSGAWTIDTNGVSTLTGNIALARMTNALNITAGAVTNTFAMVGVTNTLVMVPVGNVWVIRSVTTNP